jgi:hypothetical protein
MMRFPRLCLILAVAAVAPLRADSTSPAGDWDLVRVEPVRTSIYVGSVGLTTSDFLREGDHYNATYEARVRPWFFWNETGRLSITLTAADIERLGRGERVEFKGEATNHKNKPRHITGWAESHSPATGKIKVRIGVDDTELIFNSTYRFVNVTR